MVIHRLGTTVATIALSLVATSAPAVALPDWRTSQTVQRSSSSVRVLDLRHAQHPRFDRVVVDLRGMRPGTRSPPRVGCSMRAATDRRAVPDLHPRQPPPPGRGLEALSGPRTRPPRLTGL
jgi:hypothetical protein